MGIDLSCATCTNPRDTDCLYCVKGSRHEREVIVPSYSPTVTFRKVLLKGGKEQHVLPGLFPSKLK